LQLAGRLRGMEAAEVDRKANQLLESLALAEGSLGADSGYSKGMRPAGIDCGRAAARPGPADLRRSAVGLDIANTVLFRHLFAGAVRAGKTILYISHVLEMVERTCSRVVILYRGRVAADDSVAALRDMTKLPTWKRSSDSLRTTTIWKQRRGILPG